MASLPFTIKPVELLGGINPESGATPVFEATWYAAGAVNDGLEFHVAPGALGEAAWLTADMLLDGDESAVFLLELQEGQDGPCFQLSSRCCPRLPRVCVCRSPCFLSVRRDCHVKVPGSNRLSTAMPSGPAP